jgi:lysine 2,3-aminomutase
MAEQRTLTRPADLVRSGLAPADAVGELEAVARRYAIAIPPALRRLIDPADPADPIARQFAPSGAELLTAADETGDPTGDLTHSPAEGIVHRYPDRVLLTPTRACAVYCRFCFRRERVGPAKGAMLSPEALEAALAYVAARPEVWEVILTGGDPLILPARRLAAITARLGAIDHVKVVRIHTRLPVAAPERITPALIRAIKASGKATFVGLHVNHPRELTAEARAACARIIDAGAPMLSQSVLLRGVNDSPEVLAALMRALVESRVRPYYLHHGDAAPGTAHLRVPLAEGRALVKALRGRLSGLCQPTFVLDIEGGHGKVPVGPAYLSDDGEAVEDPWGVTHRMGS